ncbi:MAG: pyruvate kinase [Vicinamibacterales bacterium]
MRRTRILATLGPASSDPATLRGLLDAGTDAFRLNFSHGTADGHAEVCRRVRAVAAEAGRQVAVVADLGGPKIRIGDLAAPITLAEGDALVIEHGTFAGGPGRVACAFDALFTSVAVGQRLLVDDGRIELEVTGVAPGRLETRVVAGGPLEAHKGINVPNVPIRTSAVTPKDLEDLRAGIAMGVDMVALSFVQSADDVTAARVAAVAAGAPDLPLLAKIEKPAAVQRIAEILEAADGILVARGDLGIEMPLETLPAVQKQLVHAARKAAVPVIVATQVLESMRTEPRPTRAEVTDAAHAVDEGADAIMLAGETAVGRYPVRAVRTLDAIVREAERVGVPMPVGEIQGGMTEHERAICEAAVMLAHRTRATALIAVTKAGKTARALAALRPGVPIYAGTPNAPVVARLALVWGVTPFFLPDASAAAARQSLLDRQVLAPGSVVVYVSVHPVLGRDDVNFVHVGRL